MIFYGKITGAILKLALKTRNIRYLIIENCNRVVDGGSSNKYS